MYVNTSVECETLPKNERIEKLGIYKFVGYTSVAINLEYSNTKNYKSILHEIQKNTTLCVYGKVLLYPKTIDTLKKILNSLQIHTDQLIAVHSTDKEILTFSANDSRVDIISIPRILDLMHITPGIISLVKSNKKFLEISLNDIVKTKIHERSRLFHELSKFLQLIGNNTHILLHGGSEDSVYQIRGPFEIVTIFNAIFDVPLNKSKLIVKSNPEQLIRMLNERSGIQYKQFGVRAIPWSE